MKRYQVEYSTVNPAYEEGAKMCKIASYFLALIVLFSLLS
jgi:hypothetical protein